MSGLFSNDTSNPLIGNPYQNEFAKDKRTGYPDSDMLAELARRDEMQQQFALMTPNYTQQSINALDPSGIKIFNNTNDILNQNRDNILNDKQEAYDKLANKLARKENRTARREAVKEWFNNNDQEISAGLSMAGAIGNHFLNKSYKGNQGAYVSGAFGKNQMYDDIANTNTTIAATDFNDAYQQQRGITNQLNAQKTKELSGGQIAGMAGVGAAKGASAGAAFGPYGAIIGGAVGGIAGGAKGLLANNQIKDSNLMVSQKQQEANNYMQNAMSGIRQRNANLQKQSAYNMYAYNNAYGGNLNKKHKVGDVIDIDSKAMKQMLDEGYTFEKSYDVDDVIDIDDNELKRLKKLGYEYEIV